MDISSRKETHWIRFTIVADEPVEEKDCKRIQLEEGYDVRGYGFIGWHWFKMDDGKVVTSWRCDASSGN